MTDLNKPFATLQVLDDKERCVRCHHANFGLYHVKRRTLKGDHEYRWEHGEMVSDITITEGAEIPDPPKIWYEETSEVEQRCLFCGNRAHTWREAIE